MNCQCAMTTGPKRSETSSCFGRASHPADRCRGRGSSSEGAVDVPKARLDVLAAKVHELGEAHQAAGSEVTPSDMAEFLGLVNGAQDAVDEGPAARAPATVVAEGLAPVPVEAIGRTRRLRLTLGRRSARSVLCGRARLISLCSRRAANASRLAPP